MLFQRNINVLDRIVTVNQNSGSPGMPITVQPNYPKSVEYMNMNIYLYIYISVCTNHINYFFYIFSTKIHKYKFVIPYVTALFNNKTVVDRCLTNVSHYYY